MTLPLMKLLCAVLCISSPSPSRGASPRNILFLIEDDGSMDLSIYGNTVISSPNIASLAAQGTTFDAAYTTVSSCSPSRAALLSGLPSHQNGMYGLQHSVEHFQSFEGVLSTPNILTANAYTTGIIGKYHVWPNDVYNFTWGNDPTGPGGCQTGASSACPSTDYNLVTRNITYMAQQASLFLDYAAAQQIPIPPTDPSSSSSSSVSAPAPFYLYIGFGDSHRCGGAVGEFCEKYGIDTKTNKSTIPDWIPSVYDPATVEVPFWIQDTPIARQDIAHMYCAKNRMDQGVGLMMKLLQERNLLDSTLIVYTADNGAPFASGKTNMYDVATIEPLVMVMPGAAQVGVRSDVLASTLDFLPTFLDWAHISMPQNYSVLGVPVNFTGKSLLPFIGANGSSSSSSSSSSSGESEDRRSVRVSNVDEEILQLKPSLKKHRNLQTTAEMSLYAQQQQTNQQQQQPQQQQPTPLPSNYSRIYASFQLHEIQEYFPMRTVVASTSTGTGGGPSYRLIYNIAHWLPYPIASDLWSAPAMQDLVAREAAGENTYWYKNVTEYLYVPDARGVYELFDLVTDPQELNNVINVPEYATIAETLKADVKAWQYRTNDDWIIKYTHE